MDKPLCSLLVIVNKESVYRAFLDNLQTQQDISFEVIPIENKNGEYTSAREAFSYGITKASAEYLIFCHPDIVFSHSHTLRDLMQQAQTLQDFGVLGVAGTPAVLQNGDRVILSNIIHGENKQPAGIEIQAPTAVQTVDECLFIIKAETLRQTPFSKQEGWHLYAVEYCLNMLCQGKTNYVLPASLWHISNGKSLDWRYLLQLESLIAEYKTQFACINTTVKKWPTRGLLPKLYRRYYLLKQWIKSKLFS